MSKTENNVKDADKLARDKTKDGKYSSDKFDQMDARREVVEYRPPSQLNIDEDIKEYFRERGFYTKWIRFRLGEKLDTRNIRRKMHPSEGYTFVRPEEIDDEALIRVGDIEDYAGGSVITNGDVVLMKVRIEQAEARREYFQTKTRNQSEAINKRLRDNEIESGSHSIIRTGKNAHFSKQR